MMPTKTLAEVLASAPTATSLSGLSMLLRNSAGGLASAALTNEDLKQSYRIAWSMNWSLTDFDTAKSSGIYNVGPDVMNRPPFIAPVDCYGVLLVFHAGYFGIQIFFSTTSKVAVRTFSKNEFTVWFQIA